MNGVGEPGRNGRGLVSEARSLWRDWRATAAGALAGAVAFGVVYVATFAIQSGEARNTAGFVEDLARFLGPDAGALLRSIANWLEPDPGQVVSWFVYASHFVPLELDGDALGRRVHEVVDVQAFSGWNDALLFVPPVVLVLAGFAVSWLITSSDREQSPASWLTGVRLALGYAGTALVVLASARYERSIGFASATVAPDAVTVGLHTGAYALVFGTIGAVLYATYEAEPWRNW